MTIFLIIVIAIIVIGIVIYVKSKKLPLDTCVMINGGVGSGKTSTAVYLAIKSYRKEYRNWRFKRFLYYKCKLHLKCLKTYEEEPLLYSNIPLAKVKYVPFTNDMILRKERFNYKSIILLSESSLIANSMSYKDKNINDELTLFIKLIRHELKGTYCNVPNLIIETQSLQDNHYSFDRCITQSLFLTKKVNIPFFRFVKCREILTIPQVNNIIDDDIEKSMSFRWLIVPKSVFKKYDSYCYSVLSDDLPINAKSNFNKQLVKDFEIASLLDNKEISEYNRKVVSDNGK